jgi:hypothetical protein
MFRPIATLLTAALLAGCGAHPQPVAAARAIGAPHAAGVPTPLAAAVARAVAAGLAPAKVANVLVLDASPTVGNPDLLQVSGVADLTEAGKKTDEVDYGGKFDKRTGAISELEAVYWYEEDGPGSAHDLLVDALKKHYHGGVSDVTYQADGFDGMYTFEATISRKTTTFEVSGTFDRFKTSNAYYGEHPEGPFSNLKEH